jgi:hypothetical protein
MCASFFRQSPLTEEERHDPSEKTYHHFGANSCLVLSFAQQTSTSTGSKTGSIQWAAGWRLRRTSGAAFLPAFLNRHACTFTILSGFGGNPFFSPGLDITFMLGDRLRLGLSPSYGNYVGLYQVLSAALLFRGEELHGENYTRVKT